MSKYMSVRQILSAMGYREETPKKWLKPIGFSLLGYSEELGEWFCWIPIGPITAESPEIKTGLWTSKKLEMCAEDGDEEQQSRYFMHRLKVHETYDMKAAHAGPMNDSALHLRPEIHYLLE